MKIIKYKDYNEALATDCQTNGAIYNTIINSHNIALNIDLPFELNITHDEAIILDANIHNAMELVLAPYFTTKHFENIDNKKGSIYLYKDKIFVKIALADLIKNYNPLKINNSPDFYKTLQGGKDVYCKFENQILMWELTADNLHLKF